MSAPSQYSLMNAIGFTETINPNDVIMGTQKFPTYPWVIHGYPQMPMGNWRA